MKKTILAYILLATSFTISAGELAADTEITGVANMGNGLVDAFVVFTTGGNCADADYIYLKK